MRQPQNSDELRRAWEQYVEREEQRQAPDFGNMPDWDLEMYKRGQHPDQRRQQ